jgi:hypothetical protein
MDGVAKSRQRLRRIAAVAGALIISAVVIILIAVHFYLNGNSFKARVESALKKELGVDAAIGSLEFSFFSGLKVTNLSVNNSDGPFLAFKSAEVSTTLFGLAQRRVEGVVVSGPRIYIRLKKKDETAEEPARPFSLSALPITLKHLSVTDAEVLLVHPDKTVVTIAPIGLKLDDVGNNKSKVQISARLLGMESDIRLATVIDMQKLSLESGRVDFGAIDLSALPDALVKKAVGRKLRGVASSSVNIASGKGGSLLVTLDARLKNAGLEGAKGLLSNGLDGNLGVEAVVAPDFKSADLKMAARGGLSGEKASDGHKLDATMRYENDSISVEKLDFSSASLGAVSMKGKARDITKDAEMDFDIRLSKFSLNAAGNLAMPGPASLKGALDGRVTAVGKSTALGFTTDLKISGLSIESAGKPVIDLSNRPIAFKSKGRFDVKKSGKKAFMLTRADADVTGLGPITLSGGVEDLNAGLAGLSAKLSMAGSEVGALFGLLGKNTLAQKNSLHGAVKTDISIAPASGKLMGSLGASLSGGGFSAPDGSTMAEGVKLSVKSNFTYSPTQKMATFDGRLDTESLEFLSGRFYGDFSKRPMSVSFIGEYSANDRALKLNRVDASLNDVGGATISGVVRHDGPEPEFDVALTLGVPSVATLYDVFVRDTFKESSAMLAGLVVEGGVNLKLNASGALSRFGASGDFSLKNSRVDAGSGGPTVEGINIALPFEVAYPGATASEPRRFGLVEIKNMSASGLRLEAIKLEPAIYRNALRLKNDITLPLYGGEVRVKGLVYDKLLASDRALSFSVDVSSLDLAEISTAFGLPLLNGDVTGSIPSAIFKSGSLSTDGTVALKLFNGEVRITDMAVENLLGHVPSIRSSIEMKGIDLAQATDALEFGRISGVIEGFIKNLVITDGQPESFVVRLETVRTRGVPQEISVTALNKISVFGSGGVGGALNRGIYRMFKEYRYSKMGFSGSLRNDVFTLEGIETTGSKGYLVKGGTIPPMVDVVTYNQKISFKELVERIKRVQQTE